MLDGGINPCIQLREPLVRLGSMERRLLRLAPRLVQCLLHYALGGVEIDWPVGGNLKAYVIQNPMDSLLLRLREANRVHELPPLKGAPWYEARARRQGTGYSAVGISHSLTRKFSYIATCDEVKPAFLADVLCDRCVAQ